MNTSLKTLARRWRRNLSARAGGLMRLRLVLAVVAFACVGTPAVTSGAETSENEVKAAFLLNFPKYVDWPATCFAQSNSPVTVAILGDAGLADNFEKTIAGKTVNGRPLILRKLTSAAEFTNDCHILYLAAGARRSAELLPRLHGASILTVSDEENFLDQGGAIRFVRRDQKIRLEVNLTAAHEAGLKISSKLLSVADAVKGTQK